MSRILLLATAGLILLTSAPVRAQESSLEFVAEPASGSALAPGGYFLVDARPGESVPQALLLRNEAGTTLGLHVAPVDVRTGPLGGVSYDVARGTPQAVGSWIRMDDEVVTLAPGEARRLSFRIEVPIDATSGDHLAGIAIWVPAEADRIQSAAPGQAAAGVSVQTRRIIAVQVRTPGPSDPHLTITGVEPAARPDGLYLEIGITNDGLGLTKGEGVIELPDEGFVRDFPLDTFVPDTAIAYPIQWTDQADDGTYAARVEIRYGDQVATWEGTFTVGEEVQEELATRQTNRPPRDWSAILTMVGFALAAVVLLLWLWDRRRRPAPAPVFLGSSPQPLYAQPSPAPHPFNGRAVPPPPPPLRPSPVTATSARVVAPPTPPPVPRAGGIHVSAPGGATRRAGGPPPPPPPRAPR